MSRCPKLDYESNTLFGNYDDNYICKCTGQKMSVNDSKVNNYCKGSYDAYRNCDIYKRS